MTRDNNPDRLDDGARAEAEMKEREAPASATESLLADAREALEPFSAAYDRCAPEPHEIEMYGAAHPDSMADDKLAMTFPTIGDLRRARATLSRLKQGEKGGGDV